jgi:hypothetical protein
VTFDFYTKKPDKVQGIDALARTQKVKEKQQGITE